MTSKCVVIAAICVILVAVVANATPTINERELIRDEIVSGILDKDDANLEALRETFMRNRRAKKKSYPRNCYFSPIQCLFTRD